ncbi:nucleotide exchange factor GrpE [soil metagenome]|jgi:molecular chaperone GrpE
MADQTPTPPGSNPGAGTPPAPGFTFADKRKIGADGRPRATPEPDPVTPDPEGGAAANSTVDDELAELATDANALLAAERLSDLQRLQAEYANYRKRVDRDRLVARDTAIGSVIESLLPVLDDIQLARQHGDLTAGPFASIAEKLEATLARYGVERFGEPGTPFDPSIHDALMHVEEELAEGTEVTTVVGVLQPGYKLGEKILRPARVSVADPQ